MSGGVDLRLRIPASAVALKGMRREVERAALAAGCDEQLAARVVLAVNEACMNVIQHGYRREPSGELLVEVRHAGGLLTCRVEDSAKPADFESFAPRPLDEIRPGGLGTHFIAEIMDECVYGHLSGGRGNFVEMRKKVT